MAQKIIPLVQEHKKAVRGTYIKELKAEFRRISWTSREELLQGAKVVVQSTFVFGFGIYLTDLAVRGFLSWLHVIIHKMIG